MVKKNASDKDKKKEEETFVELNKLPRVDFFHRITFTKKKDT